MVLERSPGSQRAGLLNELKAPYLIHFFFKELPRDFFSLFLLAEGIEWHGPKLRALRLDGRLFAVCCSAGC